VTGNTQVPPKNIPWLLVSLFVVTSVVGSIWIIAFDGLSVLLAILTAIDEHVTNSSSNNLAIWLGAYALLCLVSQPQRFDLLTTRFSFPPDWDRLVREEGFFATVVIRLTPVIPSAAACLLAAGLNIGLIRFIPATIAVCWIRPLFFASVGGSLQALSGISEAASASAALKPLLLLFIAAFVVFLSRLYLRRRGQEPGPPV